MTKTLLSLCYYYRTISCSTFQTKRYAQNSYSHILFFSIFPQNFCYRLAVLPMKETFPCATGTKMLNNVLCVQSQQCLSELWNVQRFKLSIPFIPWAWSNNSDSCMTRRGYSRICNSTQPAVTFVYPTSAFFVGECRNIEWWLGDFAQQHHKPPSFQSYLETITTTSKVAWIALIFVFQIFTVSLTP